MGVAVHVLEDVVSGLQEVLEEGYFGGQSRILEHKARHQARTKENRSHVLVVAHHLQQILLGSRCFIRWCYILDLLLAESITLDLELEDLFGLRRHHTHHHGRLEDECRAHGIHVDVFEVGVVRVDTLSTPPLQEDVHVGEVIVQHVKTEVLYECLREVLVEGL